MYPSESSLQGLCVGLSIHYHLLGPRDYYSGLFMAPTKQLLFTSRMDKTFSTWRNGKQEKSKQFIIRP